MYTAPILITLGLIAADVALYWIGMAVIRTVERKRQEKRQQRSASERPRAAV